MGKLRKGGTPTLAGRKVSVERKRYVTDADLAAIGLEEDIRPLRGSRARAARFRNGRWAQLDADLHADLLWQARLASAELLMSGTTCALTMETVSRWSSVRIRATSVVWTMNDSPLARFCPRCASSANA